MLLTSVKFERLRRLNASAMTSISAPFPTMNRLLARRSRITCPGRVSLFPADAAAGICRISPRAIRRKRPAVAVAVEIRSGERRERPARGGGRDRGHLKTERKLIRARHHETM